MNEPTNITKLYRIGNFDQRITIQRAAESQTYGEPILTWSTYATRWANVQPRGGNEAVMGDTLQPFSRIRVVMRYDNLITEKMRIVWEEKTYNIVSIDIIPRRRFLDITAESYSIYT